MAYEARPNASVEFPPWAVTAYGIAVKNGYRGTEREFRMTLSGTDGMYCLPMLLVTTEDEDDISDDYEAIMRPSADEYAYTTEKNEFRTADENVQVPDGLDWTDGVLSLTCGGTAFGTEAALTGTVPPAVTQDDDGKILKVVRGAWTAAAL